MDMMLVHLTHVVVKYVTNTFINYATVTISDKSQANVS